MVSANISYCALFSGVMRPSVCLHSCDNTSEVGGPRDAPLEAASCVDLGEWLKYKIRRMPPHDALTSYVARAKGRGVQSEAC